MNIRRAGFAATATLLLAGTTVVFAQTQFQPPPRPDGPSPEVRARLQDGRMAMIKESLKLNEAQLKLWTPVEAQLRARFAARQKARAERRERFERPDRAERPSLADRLDRRSQRMAERAERAKALADAFRPFYASLSDDQKAVAGVVLRPMWGERRFEGRRMFMRRAEQK